MCCFWSFATIINAAINIYNFIFLYCTLGIDSNRIFGNTKRKCQTLGFLLTWYERSFLNVVFICIPIMSKTKLFLMVKSHLHLFLLSWLFISLACFVDMLSLFSILKSLSYIRDSKPLSVIQVANIFFPFCPLLFYST